MTDETIMIAVRNGDLNSASVLFDRYNKRIFNFLASMTSDRSAAEDLAQNVFLRMIKYRNSFKDESRFQPWIYQIARNVFSDYYNTQKTRANNIDVERISDHIADHDESGGLEEKEQLLHACMARLKDEDRELLVLTRFQHLKYEEVAMIMETTVANVKVRVHRAIGKLREYYFELDKV
jgi:RNA polymerase sigma-70 factor (ECF subfamily)